MDCAKAKEYLHDYIDEALPASHVRELEQHLQSCPDCALDLKRLRALSQALRSLPQTELPSGFTQALHEKLAAEPKPARPALMQRGWAKGLAAAAALVLVIGVVALGGNTLSGRGALTPMPGATPTMNQTAAAIPAPEAPASSYMSKETFALDEAGEIYYDYSYGTADDVAYNIENLVEPEMAADIWGDSGYSAKTIGIASELDAVSRAGGSEAAEQPEEQPGILRSEQQLERKIIRDANLSLKVDDFAAAYQNLSELAGRYGGYVVSGDAYSYDGETMQRGYIMLRVEAYRLEEALTEIESMGKVENRNTYTQDVTMDYYDIAGRLNQYRTQEKRLLEILNKAETVEDLVTVERELTRLRAQLESLTGQLRYYDQMTTLSSISVSLYQPDAATQTVRLSGWAGFTQDIKEGFIGGVNRLIRSAFALVIWLARQLPLLLLLAVVVTVPVVLIKRKRRK